MIATDSRLALLEFDRSSQSIAFQLFKSSLYISGVKRARALVHGRAVVGHFKAGELSE